MWAGLVNVAIRTLGLAGKFVLMVYLARCLDLDALGAFSIIALVVAYSVFVVGLDFYNYSTRQISQGDVLTYCIQIKSQLILHLGSYVVLFPVLIIAFVAGIIPWGLLPWFFLLLVLEHLSTEVHRLLIALSQPFRANIVLLIKNGLWVFAAIPLAIVYPQFNSVEYFLTAWCTGGAISLAFGSWALWPYLRSHFFSAQIDWSWIRTGVGVAIPFLFYTLVVKTAESLDRLFIQLYFGDASVGVYSFYFGVAGTIQIFVYTGVTMTLLPSLLRSVEGGAECFVSVSKEFLWKTVLVSSLFSTIFSIGIHPILWMVGKQELLSHVSVFYLLVVAFWIMCLGLIPHYMLYALKLDRSILLSGIFALGVAFASNLLFTPWLGLTGSGISVIAFTLVLGLAKTYSLALYLRGWLGGTRQANPSGY